MNSQLHAKFITKIGFDFPLPTVSIVYLSQTIRLRLRQPPVYTFLNDNQITESSK